MLAGCASNGLSRMVVEDFQQPSVWLDYYRQPDGTATAGTYKGLDRFGRTGTQAWRACSAGALREQLAYGYDYNSNRTYRQNVLAGTSNKYDELYAHDDLTLANNAYADGSFTGTGDLDQVREHNKANEIADTTQDGHAITQGQDQSAWHDPAQDARGNMTTVPKPGDMTDTYTCIYDAWNRLVKVQTNGESPAPVAEYRYDGLGRRIRKSTPDGSNWTVLDFYYNVNWQFLEMR